MPFIKKSALRRGKAQRGDVELGSTLSPNNWNLYFGEPDGSPTIVTPAGAVLEPITDSDWSAVYGMDVDLETRTFPDFAPESLGFVIPAGTYIVAMRIEVSPEAADEPGVQVSLQRAGEATTLGTFQRSATDGFLPSFGVIMIADELILNCYVQNSQDVPASVTLSPVEVKLMKII